MCVCAAFVCMYVYIFVCCIYIFLCVVRKQNGLYDAYYCIVLHNLSLLKKPKNTEETKTKKVPYIYNIQNSTYIPYQHSLWYRLSTLGLFLRQTNYVRFTKEFTLSALKLGFST